MDIADDAEALAWSVAHDDAGITSLVAQLQPLHPTLIVMEATGGLETFLYAALTAAGLPPWSSILDRYVTLPKP